MKCGRIAHVFLSAGAVVHTQRCVAQAGEEEVIDPAGDEVLIQGFDFSYNLEKIGLEIKSHWEALPKDSSKLTQVEHFPDRGMVWVRIVSGFYGVFNLIAPVDDPTSVDIIRAMIEDLHEQAA